MNEPVDDPKQPKGVIEGSHRKSAPGEGDRVEANQIVPPASIDEQLARFEDALKEEDWGINPVER